MTFFSIAGIATAISSLFMGLVMLFGGGKRIHIIWLLFCASMMFLGISMIFLGHKSTDSEMALFLWRFAYIGVVNLPALTLIAVSIVLERKELLKKSILIAFTAITLIFHALNGAGNLIAEVTLGVGGIYFDMPMSTSFKIFLLYFNATFVWIFFVILKGCIYAKRIGNQELGKKAKFLGLGISIGMIGGLSVYLPLFGISLYPYASILMGFYPLIIGYAILRHRLFDARYAILQVTRILTISLLGGMTALVLYRASVNFLGYTPQFNPIEGSIWMIAIGVIATLYKSQKISGIFLISSLAALEKETESFLKKKGVYKNQTKLVTDLEGLFYRGSKIRQVDILSDASVLEYPHIIKYFEKYRKPLVLNELETEEVEGENTLLVKEVRGLGEGIFPIENIGGKGFYFLILGKKESEEQITEKEIKIINRILPKVALALQVLDYHKSLQEEVKSQTKILNIKNRQLSEANSKLQEIDKNKDNFLAIASHELRTPMTIIRGYSDLFLKETLGSLNETARMYMQRIYNSSEGLIELVNNILDISKIEAGRFEINKAPMNISETLEKCIENFSTLYEQKGIVLSLTNSCNKNTILTDESKFVLICTNLLSNAYKFTETGGTVTIKAWEEGSMLAVRIEDTGKGIEESRIGHIFEKFNQTDNTSYKNKSIHGSGLGLYLCHLIIQLLGGKIEAESHFGKGSIFTFFIPFTNDSHTS